VGEASSICSRRRRGGGGSMLPTRAGNMLLGDEYLDPPRGKLGTGSRGGRWGSGLAVRAACSEKKALLEEGSWNKLLMQLPAHRGSSVGRTGAPRRGVTAATSVRRLGLVLEAGQVSISGDAAPSTSSAKSLGSRGSPEDLDSVLPDRARTAREEGAGLNRLL